MNRSNMDELPARAKWHQFCWLSQYMGRVSIIHCISASGSGGPVLVSLVSVYTFRIVVKFEDFWCPATILLSSRCWSRDLHDNDVSLSLYLFIFLSPEIHTTDVSEGLSCRPLGPNWLVSSEMPGSGLTTNQWCNPRVQASALEYVTLAWPWAALTNTQAGKAK